MRREEASNGRQDGTRHKEAESVDGARNCNGDAGCRGGGRDGDAQGPRGKLLLPRPRGAWRGGKQA